MRNSRSVAALTLAAGFLVSAMAAAPAQTYPSRPITMVVPFAAGGTTDAIARILGENLSQTLGQQIVIENVGGAGGSVGAARVHAPRPTATPSCCTSPAWRPRQTLYPKLSFDAEKDFTGVGLINTSASIIAGSNNVPANNIKDW